MRGDHAGLLKIEAEMAKRVRSTTSMVEGMEGTQSSGIWSDIGRGLYY
jgi:hypothetical protein